MMYADYYTAPHRRAISTTAAGPGATTTAILRPYGTTFIVYVLYTATHATYIIYIYQNDIAYATCVYTHYYNNI